MLGFLSEGWDSPNRKIEHLESSKSFAVNGLCVEVISGAHYSLKFITVIGKGLEEVEPMQKI